MAQDAPVVSFGVPAWVALGVRLVLFAAPAGLDQDAAQALFAVLAGRAQDALLEEDGWH